MDFQLVLQYMNVVFREVWKRKFLSIFGFAMMSFIVLVIGFLWPSKFETEATIFADNQNILKPLLQNQAAQSKVTDQAKVVRDKILSPSIMNKVIESTYGLDSFESAEELAAKVSGMRSRIKVKGIGSSFIRINYHDETSHEAYHLINNLIDTFIKSSSEEQRSESREAYLFIDNQVKQYKEQLVLAEERLKEFNAENYDGRDRDVDQSISRIRSQVENLKISIDEDQTTIKSLKAQLAEESEFSAKKVKAGVYQERLLLLEERLSALLLSYTDDYPDVVSVKYQIEDIKTAIAEADETESDSSQSEDDIIANPLYQELRSRLSIAETNIQTKKKRLIALEGLKAQEFERRKRVAGRAAEEAELTRDYTVTRKIYEDMLERKEKARLSMTLNVEGQGVTYRVQEPALPPLSPTGLRTLHFVILGPFVGVFFVFGLALLFVLVDPRVRFPSRLEDLGVETLAVIPHINTRFSKRISRMDIFVCFILGVVIMIAYVGLAYAYKVGLF